MSDSAGLAQSQASGSRSRPAPIEVEVVRVEAKTGGFVRVVLGGAALESFVWPGPGSHLKFFPPSEQAFAGTGSTTEQSPRPASRTYTPRSFDPASGELAIDFLLHGEGLASKWAAEAKPGDRVRVSVPRAVFRAAPDATWQLLAGDDSAVPAISTIIESGISVPTEVIVETRSLEGSRPMLPDHPLVALEWVTARPEYPGTALEEGLDRWAVPEGPGSLWVGAEAVAVRRIRKTLLETRRIAPDVLVTRGYWREGAVNHPDHDFATDELET